MYNAAQFSAINQNLVQGQIHSLSLNEINFPFDIPNMQTGFNYFLLYATTGAHVDFTVTVPPGFYTGTELATIITQAIHLQGAAQDPPLLPDDLPTCTFDEISNRFTFNYTDQRWEIISPYTNPSPGLLPSNRLGKDILSIMGYPPSQGPLQIGPGVDGLQVAVSGSAPLAFTQYIDICSPQLCKYQEFAGGSTTNLARRGDLICRLYIANNIAVEQGGNGTRPYIINRQYFNARIMKWTTGNSVGQMDINLYDDVGQPLQTTWAPRSYQITFNVYEGGDEMEQVMDSATGQTMTLRRFAPYQPENAQAWSSGTFPMRSRR